MKKIFNCFLGVIIFFPLQAQLPDSIYQLYSKEKNPSEKGKILVEALNLRKNPSQETLGLLLTLDGYFKEKKDETGIDYTAVFTANILERFGNFNEALKLAMPLLPRFEQRRDTFGILRSYVIIGNSNINADNVEQGLSYYKKALQIAYHYTDTVTTATFLNNIADGYKRLGKLDSALFYSQNAVRLSEQVGDKFSLATQMGTMGEIYLAKNDLEIGRSIVKKAIAFAVESKNRHTLGFELNELSRSYMSTNDLDSSIVYAKAALSVSYPDFKVMMMESYQNLYKNYDLKGNRDSAFRYFRLGAMMKDSIFSSEKNRNIQAINIQEQLREQRLKDDLAKQKKDRLNNLQYSAIAIGLLTFIIFVLLMSRYTVAKEKFIRFIGILGLLAVFEFINLFIHPYLDRLTNHSPVLMLLILMCIAALLIPLHHKLEHWIIHKLVEKNKRIRLLAARKTIEQLEGNPANKETQP